MTEPTFNVGDHVTLTATISEIRPDGTVVLAVNQSTSIIPAVVLTTVDMLAGKKVDKVLVPGASVSRPTGERGKIVPADDAIPRRKRLQGRTDVLLVKWEGRSLPTWEAPEDVRAD